MKRISRRLGATTGRCRRRGRRGAAPGWHARPDGARARRARVWPVNTCLFGELLANRVRSYAARLTAGQAHATPHAPAAAPTSPGMPPVDVEPAGVLAFRRAQAELRRTSRLPALNT